MTIRHLRIFIEVAESGKMSLAASKFFLSQPTVSQVIAELESHYEVRLFERLSKRLHITSAGRTLLAQAKQVVASFDDLERTMRQTGSKQPLRMGASVTVGTCLMNRVSDQFRKRNSEAPLSVYVNNTSVIEKQLLDSALDLALVEGEIKSPDLVVTPVTDDYLVLVCSAAHPFAHREVICPQELGQEMFILREKGSGTRELFEQFMEEQHIPLHVAWVCNNSEAIKNAVLGNQGLSVISARLVENEILEQKIHVVRLQECVQYRHCIWKRNFKLVLHKDKYITPAVSAMRETVLSFAEDEVAQWLPAVPAFYDEGDS